MQLKFTPELFKALRWLGLRKNPPMRAHVVAVAILEDYARGELLKEIEANRPLPAGTALLLDKTFNKQLPGKLRRNREGNCERKN